MLKKLLLTSVPASGWPGTPVEINDNGAAWGMPGHRAVVKTAGGDLYANINTGDLRAYLSEDGGLSWSLQDDLNRPTDCSPVNDLDIDSNGVIHNVYLSSDNPAKVQHVTFDTSTNSWGTPETIDTITTQVTNTYWRVGCAVDDNDDLHVLYCDGGATTVKYTNNISDDWTKTPVTITSTGYHGTICLDESNYPVVLYGDASNGMFAARGNAVNATSFGTPQNIGSESGSKGSVACDSGGNIWAAWGARTPYGAAALKASKHNVGDGWDTWNPVTVDSNAVNLDSNIMCIGTAVYIFCTHASTGIWYWTNATGSWVSHELDSGALIPLARWSNNNNPNYDDGIDYIFLLGDWNTNTVCYNRVIL